MRKQLATAICCVAAMSMAALCSTTAIAQQKTEKACQEEWRSQKAAMQAAGTTEKAYVEKCRTATAQPATVPTAKPTSTPTAATSGEKKTVKECEGEWRAQKAAMQASGKTEKAYVEECRGGAATAMPTSAPAPTAATPAPATAAPEPKTTARPASAPAPTATTGTPAGAGQFASEAQAKAQCPTDTVVWVNLSSNIYHFSGTKDYGTTKKGAYMCERNTASAGFRASKAEKHP